MINELHCVNYERMYAGLTDSPDIVPWYRVGDNCSRIEPRGGEFVVYGVLGAHGPQIVAASDARVVA